MPLGVFRCVKLESEVRLPGNLIGRPGTNGNRVRQKHAFLRYLDTGNPNLTFKHLEIPSVDHK